MSQNKSDILCTFPGMYGDVLWSLATARRIAMKLGKAVDFAIMPAFSSLLPLLNYQSYINRAFVLDDWIEQGRHAGCQPWQSPQQYREYYQEVIDLGYKCHPAPTPLCDFIARQQSIQLDGEPFIEFEDGKYDFENYIAYAFNPSYPETKEQFFYGVLKGLGRTVGGIEVSKLSWLQAAIYIHHAKCFVGCRSANYVLAHGIGQKVICFEPETWRREATYSYPFGIEKMCFQSDEAINQINIWKQEVKTCV